MDLPQHETLFSLKYFYNLELMLASCEIFTDYVGTAEVWTIVAISISLEDKHQITELFELTQITGSQSLV